MRGYLLLFLLISVGLFGPSVAVYAQRGRDRNKTEVASTEVDPRTRTRLDMLYVDACTEMIRGDLAAARQLFLKLLQEDPKGNGVTGPLEVELCAGLVFLAHKP